MSLPHASLAAGLVGLLVFALGLNTSLRRMRTGIYKSDGGDEGLRRASRAHGLAVEHGVLLIVLLALLELQGAPAQALLALAVSIVVVRLWSALSTLRLLTVVPGSVSAGLTYTLEFVLSAWLLATLLR